MHFGFILWVNSLSIVFLSSYYRQKPADEIKIWTKYFHNQAAHTLAIHCENPGQGQGQGQGQRGTLQLVLKVRNDVLRRPFGPSNEHLKRIRFAFRSFFMFYILFFSPLSGINFIFGMFRTASGIFYVQLQHSQAAGLPGSQDMPRMCVCVCYRTAFMYGRVCADG